MGQTAPNGMMLPEQRSMGWGAGTLRARGQASIAVVK